MPRRSAAAVAGSRSRVVELAVRRASVEGLEGLTIGRLADEVAMSKSGLFGLFGGKEQLQLAVLQAGSDLFVHEVWAPVEAVEPGRPRLLALCDSWLAFLERDVLPGGCFMTTVVAEFDARPGPLKEAASRALGLWLRTLEREAGRAVQLRQLPARSRGADIAFELNALASAASTTYKLFGDRSVFDRARRSMHRVLAAPGAASS